MHPSSSKFNSRFTNIVKILVLIYKNGVTSIVKATILIACLKYITTLIPLYGIQAHNVTS